MKGGITYLLPFLKGGWEGLKVLGSVGIYCRRYFLPPPINEGATYEDGLHLYEVKQGVSP
jgi:hypothetical protein